ncbi:hypothetical protein BpHYR1_017627 [Brachionus plicatilis]|uniref:Uncharacterized protein n=1 Tax=Brachionus plicatilis TaxID=10195 RepID=A0A3M7SDH4_BRAPC|nr:hypothetical protein BpHYR1_017627 [Brachionus plicatilis]
MSVVNAGPRMQKREKKRLDIFTRDQLMTFHHNSAVSRSQAQDEKRGGWWQPHYVVFYESEEELYYGYIDLRVFVLVLSYEGAAGLTIIQYRILAERELVLQLTLCG